MELGLKGKRVIIPASTKGILRRVVDQLIDEGYKNEDSDSEEEPRLLDR